MSIKVVETSWYFIFYRVDCCHIRNKPKVVDASVSIKVQDGQAMTVVKEIPADCIDSVEMQSNFQELMVNKKKSSIDRLQEVSLKFK